MHISTGTDTPCSISSQTAPDVNKLPDEHAKSPQAPSRPQGIFDIDDIFDDLNNFIPVGSFTVNVETKAGGVPALWPTRNEWKEADTILIFLWLGIYEVERVLRELITHRIIRVFARSHPHNDQQGTFRLYGKIHGENV